MDDEQPPPAETPATADAASAAAPVPAAGAPVPAAGAAPDARTAAPTAAPAADTATAVPAADIAPPAEAAPDAADIAPPAETAPDPTDTVPAAVETPAAETPAAETPAPAPAVPAGEDGDNLPAELDVTAYVGQYTFPDIRRRRWPGYVYLLTATACFVLWATRGDGAVLVNDGMLGAAVALLAIGTYHLAAAWPLSVRDGDALVAAARQVGFPVGHASAQLGWRGLRSRPTWRILLYSNDDPPKRRGLVLVDGVDGAVLDHFVEDNPEDWAQFDT